jgi:hypothetical protein
MKRFSNESLTLKISHLISKILQLCILIGRMQLRMMPNEGRHNLIPDDLLKEVYDSLKCKAREI